MLFLFLYRAEYDMLKVDLLPAYHVPKPEPKPVKKEAEEVHDVVYLCEVADCNTECKVNGWYCRECCFVMCETDKKVMLIILTIFSNSYLYTI